MKSRFSPNPFRRSLAGIYIGLRVNDGAVISVTDRLLMCREASQKSSAAVAVV